MCLIRQHVWVLFAEKTANGLFVIVTPGMSIYNPMWECGGQRFNLQDFTCTASAAAYYTYELLYCISYSGGYAGNQQYDT